MSKSPTFPQLDRLADNEEWRDWKRGDFAARGVSRTVSRLGNFRTSRLDEIFTPDGVPTIEGEDDDT